jgi:hypothetical protein
MDYTTMCAEVVVTHVTSYDILFGGVVPYPLGIMLDFWEEIVYYQLGWQIGASHKALLPMTLEGKQKIPTNPQCWLDFWVFHMGLSKECHEHISSDLLSTPLVLWLFDLPSSDYMV